MPSDPPKPPLRSPPELGQPIATARPPSLAEQLDPCFEPLGIHSAPGALAGRSYEGTADGRPISVHCSARSRVQYVHPDISYRKYAGHRLEVQLETPVKSRLVISKPSSWFERLVARTNRWFGAARVSGLDARYLGFEIWSADPEWARAYMGDERVQKALAHLFPDGHLPPNIGLRLWPGRLTFSQRAAMETLTPKAVKSWVGALTTLASVAEEAPPSAEVELSRFEAFSVAHPTATGLLVVTLLLGVPTCLLLCGGFVVLVLLLLLTRG